MSEFIKQFKGFVAKNPEFKAILQGLAKDGHAIATMPTKIIGEVRRGYGQAVEDVADFAGDVAGTAAEWAPRITAGPDDAPITVRGQLGRNAKLAEGVAGLVEKGGEFLSDYETPAEQRRESAQAAMDRRIQDTLGQGQPSQREIFLKRKAEVEARKGKAGAEPEGGFISPGIPSGKELERHEREGTSSHASVSPTEAAAAPADTAKERMLASIKEDPTGEEYDTAFDDALPEGMEDAVSSDVDVSGAAKAVPVVPDDQAEALFKTVHGGPFDPNSSMDRGKLAQIKENLVREEYQGLSPNQFALKMYREAA